MCLIPLISYSHVSPGTRRYSQVLVSLATGGSLRQWIPNNLYVLDSTQVASRPLKIISM